VKPAERAALATLALLPDAEFADLIGMPISSWLQFVSREGRDLPCVWIGRRKLRPVAECIAALKAVGMAQGRGVREFKRVA